MLDENEEKSSTARLFSRVLLYKLLRPFSTKMEIQLAICGIQRRTFGLYSIFYLGYTSSDDRGSILVIVDILTYILAVGAKRNSTDDLDVLRVMEDQHALAQQSVSQIRKELGLES